MKVALCLLTWNELEGCKPDVPRLPLDGFDEVYAVDGGALHCYPAEPTNPKAKLGQEVDHDGFLLVADPVALVGTGAEVQAHPWQEGRAAAQRGRISISQGHVSRWHRSGRESPVPRGC